MITKFIQYNESLNNGTFKRINATLLYGALTTAFKNLTIVKDNVIPVRKNKIANIYRYPTFENLIGGEEFYKHGIIGQIYETYFNGKKDVLDVRIESLFRRENIKMVKIEEFKIIALEAIQLAFKIMTDNNINNTELFISNDYNSFFYINEKGDMVGTGNEYFSQIRNDDFFKYLLKDDIYKYIYFDRNKEKIVNLLGKTIIKGDQHINISDTGEMILNGPIQPEYMQFDIEKAVAPNQRMRAGVYRDIMAAFNKLPKPKREKVRKELTSRSYKIDNLVHHKTYGDGKITNRQGNILTIDFNGEPKKFAIDKVQLFSV